MRRFLPSPSMIVALTALVIALGGSAYAATQINGNTIRNGTITGRKIKHNSLTGRQIKRNSLTGSQIKESTLGTVRSATRAATATTALTATTAKTAGYATSAGNAATLGGVAASGFVQGGGQTFHTSVDDPQTTALQPYTVPGLGTFQIGCSNTSQAAVTMTNTTGSTMIGSYALLLSGSNPNVGGGSIANGSTAVNVLGVPAAQIHEFLVWPAGSPTHSADFTIGTFQSSDSPAHCEILISGTVS